MTHLGRFLAFDVRIHSRYLGLAIVALVALSVVAHSRRGGAAAFFLTGTLIALAPTVVAFWFIGNDRSKGTMTLLAGLPLSPPELVAIKTLEIFVVSLAFGLVSSVLAIATSTSTNDVLQLLALCVPLSLASSSLTAMAFFLLPSRIALYALMAVFFVLGHESDIVVRYVAGVSPFVRDLMSVAGSFVLALAAIGITATVWGSRPPSESF